MVEAGEVVGAVNVVEAGEVVGAVDVVEAGEVVGAVDVVEAGEVVGAVNAVGAVNVVDVVLARLEWPRNWLVSTLMVSVVATANPLSGFSSSSATLRVTPALST